MKYKLYRKNGTTFCTTKEQVMEEYWKDEENCIKYTLYDDKNERGNNEFSEVMEYEAFYFNK
jgi:hypothetical protein